MKSVHPPPGSFYIPPRIKFLCVCKWQYRSMIAINVERLWQRHCEMAQIGALPNGSIDRPGFSQADLDCLILLASWAKARGFPVSIDPIGNLFIHRAGQVDGPVVLTGSHLDTQVLGDGFDGVFGVLAGFEVLESMEDSHTETSLPVELVVWRNEEGTRFAPDCMGAKCFVGRNAPAEFLALQDPATGTTVGGALDALFAALPEAGRRDFGPAPAAFIEAHIEQGPVLQRAGKAVGVVSGVQGVRWFEVEVRGNRAHAGTAPMVGRQDALRESVAMIAALQAAFNDPLDMLRFTVGKVEVSPNTVNSVPETVLFTIDLRFPEEAVLQRLAEQVSLICHEQARACHVSVKETLVMRPTKFDPWIVTLIGRQAASLGIAAMLLPSGAFHDAVYLSEVAPTGMIFVPYPSVSCVGGEAREPLAGACAADLAEGARVLAGTLLGLAG